MFKKELHKYFSKMYLKTIGMWFVCLLCGVPIIALTFAAMYYINIFLGFVVGTLASIIGGGVINEIMSIRSFFSNPWKSIRDAKEKVTPKQVTLYTLPLLITSAVLLIFFIILAIRLDIFADFANNFELFMCIFIIYLSAIMWLFAWLFIKIEFKNLSCKTCNAVHCYELLKTDCDVSEREKTKTVNTSGTIGSVYVDNQKVGEVRGNTGSYGLKKTITTTTTTTVCKCVFCGDEKTFVEKSSQSSGWR